MLVTNEEKLGRQQGWMAGKLLVMVVAMAMTLPANAQDVVVTVGNGETEELEDFETIDGPQDYSAAAVSAEVNLELGGAWNANGTSQFSAGDDALNISSGGIFYTEMNANPASVESPVILQFSDGDDSVNNSGLFAAGTYSTNRAGDEPADEIQGLEGELRFEGLENFNNSGTILIGSRYQFSSGLDEITGSDNWFDDILSMRGTTFTGSGDSRIVVNANLNSGGQSSCDSNDPSLRLANGDLPGADCVDLRGGATAGSTLVTVTDVLVGFRGAYSPDGIVIVDVNGGTSAAGHFTIAPDSDNYSTEFGGVIDKGFFFFPLVYDEDNQQHKLYGLPGQGAQQMPLLAHAAQDLWRTSTISLFERQLDVRNRLRQGDDLGGGVWFRASTGSAERDVTQSVSAASTTFEFDSGYDQDSSAISLGVDLLAGQDGNRAWTIGTMIGYVNASLNFNQSPNDVNMEGTAFGVYGSYLAGDVFVDAAVTGNWLTVDADIPSLDLFPEGTIVSTDAQSLGAQVEAGWRWKTGWIGVEPLVSLSYVRTSFDTIEVPASDPIAFGAEVEYDDPVSFRGGLGVRLSIEDVVPNFAPTDLILTTRVVEEFDGDSAVSIVNLGPIDAPVASTFDGTFAQVTGGVTVSNTSGSASGYFNVDGTFESNYESVGIEAGFRYQW